MLSVVGDIDVSDSLREPMLSKCNEWGWKSHDCVMLGLSECLSKMRSSSESENVGLTVLLGQIIG